MCVSSEGSTPLGSPVHEGNLGGYSSQSDQRSSLEDLRPLGNGSSDAGSPRHEKTLRKGPFVYRE